MNKKGDPKGLSKQLSIMFSLFMRLLLGGNFDYQDIVTEYGVSRDTAFKYIHDLDLICQNLNDEFDISYQFTKDRHGRCSLQTSDESLLSFKEVLIVMEALLAGRFLATDDLKMIRDKLLSPFVKRNYQQELVLKELFARDLSDYTPVGYPLDLSVADIIYTALATKHKVKFEYYPPGRKPHTTIVKPIDLFIDKYYVYLHASQDDSDELRLYRLDRTGGVELLAETFTDMRPVGDPGNRQRLINAFTGSNARIQTIKLFCKARAVEYVLDEFPDSKIEATYDKNKVKHPRRKNDPYILENEEYALVSASVRGLEGSKHWILSQGDRVKVVAPLELKEMVQDALKATLKLYKD